MSQISFRKPWLRLASVVALLLLIALLCWPTRKATEDTKQPAPAPPAPVAPTIEVDFPGTIPAGQPFRGNAKVTGQPTPALTCSLPEIATSPDGAVNWADPAPGDYEVTFAATNVAGRAETIWKVKVTGVPVKITSEAITTASPEKDYGYPVTAEGTPPFRWELTKAPPGMKIDAQGKITLPKDNLADGRDYAVEVRASNTVDGETCSDAQTFTIRCRKKEQQEPKRPKSGKVGHGSKVKAREQSKPYVAEGPETQRLQAERERLEKEQQLLEDVQQQVKEQQEREEGQRKQREEQQAQLEKEREQQQQQMLAQEIKEQERLQREEKRLLKEQQLAEQARKQEQAAEREKKQAEERQAKLLKEQEEARQRQKQALIQEMAKEAEQQKQERLEAERQRLMEEEKRIRKAQQVAEEREKREEAAEMEGERRDRERAELLQKQKEARERQEEMLRQQKAQEERERQEKLRLEEEERRQREAKKQEALQQRLKKEAERETEQAAREQAAQRERQEAERKEQEQQLYTEKTAKGKKVDFTSYEFIYDGADFTGFVRLVDRMPMTIAFLVVDGGTLQLGLTPYVIKAGSSGKPEPKKVSAEAIRQLLLREYNSTKGVYVRKISQKSDWGTYDAQFRRQERLRDNYQMILFFSYAFIYDLDQAARAYYQTHAKDNSVPFKKGAGRVKFTITAVGKIKILSMSHTG